MEKRKLTNNQIWVIEEMKKQKCFLLAATTQEHWEKGEPHYIDTRVNVRRIRRKFEQGNREAEAHNE